MKLFNDLLLHKGLYFNYCIYVIWIISNGIFIYLKLDYFKIPRLLVMTAFFTISITLCLKLCLIHSRQFTTDISKLTRFFLLTALIQLPLVSFFLISLTVLLSTPLEVCLHVLLLLMTLLEGTISFFAVWKTVKCATHTTRPNPRYFPPIEMQTISRRCDLKDNQEPTLRHVNRNTYKRFSKIISEASISPRSHSYQR